MNYFSDKLSHGKYNTSKAVTMSVGIRWKLHLVDPNSLVCSVQLKQQSIESIQNLWPETLPSFICFSFWSLFCFQLLLSLIHYNAYFIESIFPSFFWKSIIFILPCWYQVIEFGGNGQQFAHFPNNLFNNDIQKIKIH